MVGLTPNVLRILSLVFVQRVEGQIFCGLWISVLVLSIVPKLVGPMWRVLKMPKMPSNATHVFSEVPRAEIPRSVFDRSHCHKTMFDSGYLIPFYVDEALPGDTFSVDSTMFARLSSALNVPIMDNLYLDTFYFAVPIRLVWPNFVKMCGEQDNPADSTSFVVPQIVAPASTGWAVGTMSDYFGLPTGIPGISVSSLWHRAYNLVWNTWFRDQNLQNSVTVYDPAYPDGPDVNANYVLLKRGKRHDYFTSCLPWAQKGPGVTLPLSGNAPVKGIGKFTQSFIESAKTVYETGGGTASYATPALVYHGSSNDDFYVKGSAATGGYPQIYADLSAVTAATINSLRLAFQIQKMYERDARGGTRYTEIVLAHFGTSSPDARLQRPEFLGGKTTPITISTVPQTSASNSQPTPQGNLAAFGMGLNSSDGFTKSFTEHTLIIGLCMVRADLTYQQGIPRMFSRSTRFDFYWPALAQIGEQAVLNKEIYAVTTVTPGDAGDLQNLAAFGYQERWAEYRYFPSKITGKLRSTYTTPLDVWHLAQKFTALPTLSSAFIVETPPVDRIVAVTTEPQFVMDSFIKIKAVRPMPVYSVPGLIDHF
nr:MAG: major capsid protein [Microviridae sp.]